MVILIYGSRGPKAEWLRRQTGSVVRDICQLLVDISVCQIVYLLIDTVTGMAITGKTDEVTSRFAIILKNAIKSLTLYKYFE